MVTARQVPGVRLGSKNELSNQSLNVSKHTPAHVGQGHSDILWAQAKKKREVAQKEVENT
eukprot:scaffold57203_cov20-Tisochrysis_lutea.AAC.2